MSEFDENKQEQNELEENKTDYTEVNNQPTDSKNNFYQQPTQPQQNVNPYSNGQGSRYYGQNSMPYGSRNNARYVYNGNNYNPYNQQQTSSPYGQQNPYNQNQQQGYNMNPQPSVQMPFENTPNNKGNKSGKKIFFSCVAIVLVVGIVMTLMSVKGKIGTSEKTTEKIDGPTLQASDSESANLSVKGELTPAGVYDKVKESSVGVLVYSANTMSAAGEGSGVIVGEDKAGKHTYIITCAHVVAKSNSVRIQLYDESQCDATVIGYDQRTDIAVLRISKTGLKAFEIGSSEKLVVGESVYAIGNPGGVDFAGSFTNGMVSAIARPISSEIGYEMKCIQHTAAINPGNSGGALVNGKGQLIGINSSKIANTDYEGMGFSVPSETFIEVYNEIIENGYVTNRPKLGITYTPVSASQTYSMLASVKNLPAGSLVIQSISKDSSLVDTNAKVGDFITKVNGKDLDTTDMLPSLVENSKVGDKLKLTICHFDNNYQMSEFEVEVSLVEDKGETENIEEATTMPNYWNPFGSYYGN